MPVEIAVGPPLLSINHGATFMVTDLGGEIQADTEQGVFADDTRFVSYYAIFASGLPWQRLNSANHGLVAVRFNLEIALRSDFADLFEVKLGHLVRRGRILTRWHDRRAE